jgi:putative SOS response-associated peptidase YedK
VFELPCPAQPGYFSPALRGGADVGDEAVPKREALLGTFGLIAPWNKNLKLSQVTAGTYNARSETVAEKPMGIAGLWERWTSPSGETILSFNMLTLNADDHPFYQQFHKPGEEKRMVVVLPQERFDD